MARKYRLKSSAKQDKMIDSSTGYVFYKDRPTLVEDTYKPLDDLIEWEKQEKTSNTEQSTKSEKKSTKKSTKKKEVDKIRSLKEINGIGEETVEDLLRAYSNVEQIKEALKKDRILLRNDQVKKLKNYFQVK